MGLVGQETEIEEIIVYGTRLSGMSWIDRMMYELMQGARGDIADNLLDYAAEALDNLKKTIKYNWCKIGIIIDVKGSVGVKVGVKLKISKIGKIDVSVNAISLELNYAAFGMGTATLTQGASAEFSLSKNVMKALSYVPILKNFIKNPTAGVSVGGSIKREVPVSEVSELFGSNVPFTAPPETPETFVGIEGKITAIVGGALKAGYDSAAAGKCVKEE
jgi:hypothetical protein